MISTETARNDYVGDGTTADYDFTFKIFSEEHLRVVVRINGSETNLVLGTDYTVEGVSEDAGGTITLVDDNQAWLDVNGFLDTDIDLIITRDVPLTQIIDFKNQSDYFPEGHENAFDKHVMMMQQLDEVLDRCLKSPVSDGSAGLELPTIAERASSFLGFDINGDPVALSSTIDPTAVAISAFIETLLDDANAATARTTLGFTGAGGTVAPGNLENNAVTTTKIADNAVTTAKLDVDLIAGLTTVTPADDDFVAISDTSDTGNNKKALISIIRNKVTRSVTSTGAAVAATDDILILSGASYTFSIPTAVGVSGKVFTIIHAGTSLSQVYNLDPQNAETIDGLTVYPLVTNGEVLEIVSDGANWIKVNHITSTPWVDSGNIVLSATTTAPTKGTTRQIDKLWWRRIGDSAQIRIEYQQDATAGAAAGSGDYLFGVPANMTIDTAKCSVYTVVGGNFLVPNIVGNFAASFGGTHYPGGQLYVYSSSFVRSLIVNAAAVLQVSSGSAAINNANLTYSGIFTVPISGWSA